MGVALLAAAVFLLARQKRAAAHINFESTVSLYLVLLLAVQLQKISSFSLEVYSFSIIEPCGSAGQCAHRISSSTEFAPSQIQARVSREPNRHWCVASPGKCTSGQSANVQHFGLTPCPERQGCHQLTTILPLHHNFCLPQSRWCES